MSEFNIEKKYKEREHQWKELLYTLFYEIKSEILGDKIELEEEEYQENVRTINIPDLVKYIHNSIQILLIKKIEDSKDRQKEEDKAYYLWKYTAKGTKTISVDQKNLYENIIINLENRERKLVSELFQAKLKNDAMESKIGEYIEIENEFEEMKAKYKYEEGRFLENDKKDNEIIIIRTENANLKKIINKLEQQIKKANEILTNKDKMINNLKEQIKMIEKNKNKNEIKTNNCIKDLSGIISSINVGISNNSRIKSNKHNNHINNKNNKQYYRNNFYLNDDCSVSTRERFSITDRLKKINSSLKHFPLSKYKKSQKKEKKNDLLSTTRNESLEKLKDDFLKKYFSGNASGKGTINTKNRNKIKMLNYRFNNHKIKLVNASAYALYGNNKRQLNNLYSMKKMFGIGGISSSKSSSKKKKTHNHHNNKINYKSISCC
jgi:hypothetical protein